LMMPRSVFMVDGGKECVRICHASVG